MAQDPCPGNCNRRYREAQEAYKQALALYDPLDSSQSRPEQPEIEPWPGDPVWCGPCSARISQRLGRLDDLASILLRYADGHRGAPDSPLVGGSAETMSPSEAKDAADDLARMFGGWEAAYRDLRGWPAPRREADTACWITASSAWLSARLTVILASPVAKDFGEEILSWHRELAARAKDDPRKLTKPLRCSSCQQLTLTWVEGEDKVYCCNPECRRVMSYTDYEAEVASRTGGAKPRVDAA